MCRYSVKDERRVWPVQQYRLASGRDVFLKGLVALHEDEEKRSKGWIERRLAPKYDPATEVSAEKWGVLVESRLSYGRSTMHQYCWSNAPARKEHVGFDADEDTLPIWNVISDGVIGASLRHAASSYAAVVW